MIHIKQGHKDCTINKDSSELVKYTCRFQEDDNQEISSEEDSFDTWHHELTPNCVDRKDEIRKLLDLDENLSELYKKLLKRILRVSQFNYIEDI